MRLLLVVAVASLVGCGPAVQGPPVPLDMQVKLKNLYAESLFTVNVYVGATDGGTGTPIYARERVAAYGTAPIRKFSAFPGDVVSFDLTGVSLGQDRVFSLRSLPPVEELKKTLAIEYDYDLALANFSIKYGWER